MDDTWTLIPIKSLDVAKTRLARVLTPSDRRALAWTLAERTLGVVAGGGFQRVAVVTSDQTVAELARALGLTVLADRGHDHSSAVAAACRWAIDKGAVGIVTLAADLPLLTASDVSALHDLLAPDTLVIAPDHTGRGTNAIGVAPPVFPFAFGPGSRRRHVASARALGLAVRVLCRDGLAIDVDRPADLDRVPTWKQA